MTLAFPCHCCWTFHACLCGLASSHPTCLTLAPRPISSTSGLRVVVYSKLASKQLWWHTGSPSLNNKPTHRPTMHHRATQQQLLLPRCTSQTLPHTGPGGGQRRQVQEHPSPTLARCTWQAAARPWEGRRRAWASVEQGCFKGIVSACRLSFFRPWHHKVLREIVMMASLSPPPRLTQAQHTVWHGQSVRHLTHTKPPRAMRASARRAQTQPWRRHAVASQEGRHESRGKASC